MPKIDLLVKFWYFKIFAEIKEGSLADSQFARNYNFLYVLRYTVLYMLLISLQSYGMLQIILTILIEVLFMGLTVYQDFKFRIFSRRRIIALRVIGDLGSTILLSILAVFGLGSFLKHGEERAGAIAFFVFWIGVVFVSSLYLIDGLWTEIGPYTKNLFDWIRGGKDKVVPTVTAIAITYLSI